MFLFGILRDLTMQMIIVCEVNMLYLDFEYMCSSEME
jgi:hypothetical protein